MAAEQSRGERRLLEGCDWEKGRVVGNIRLENE